MAIATLFIAVFVAWWQFAPDPPSAIEAQGTASPGSGAISAIDAPTKTPDAARVATQPGLVAGSTAPVRVRIDVYLPDGAPAVGATVRVGDLESITDARGSTTLLVTGTPKVTATLGNQYGEGEWPEEWDGDLTRIGVVIAPDVNLVVEVVDPFGTPQEGVRVLIEATIVTRSHGLTDPNWFLATDASGRAEIPHLQCLADFAGCVAASVRLACYGSDWRPGDHPLVERTLDWKLLAVDPMVRFVVPASGTIAVKVVSANGAPLHFDTTIKSERGDQMRADTEGDAEVFRMVPLGQTWSLWIDGVTESMRIRGPAQPGEVVRVDIPWTKHLWEFRGRLGRRDGQGLDRYAEFTLAGGQDDLSPLLTERHVMSEPFRFAVCLPTAELRQLEVRVTPAEYALAEPKVFRFERSLMSGVVDLGELVLDPPPNLVELGSCEVFLDDRVVTHDARFRLHVGEGSHSQRPFLTRRSGETLRLLGNPPDGPMRLSSWAADSLHESLALNQGEHHRIDLRRAASLRIDLAQHLVPVDAIVAELERLHVANTDAERARVQAHSLVWKGLDPGAYALTIRCGDQVLASEPELLLAPGPQRWPADGRALDFRSAKVVHVLARSGSPTGPILNVGIALASADTQSDAELDWHDGWFVPRHAATDLLVRCRDHVPIRLPRPTADVALVLQPMTRVQLHARDGEDFQVRVRVVTDGVADALLRAIDREHEHTDFHSPSDAAIPFAPGTELEITRVTGDQPAPVHRVKVAAAATQLVELF